MSSASGVKIKSWWIWAGGLFVVGTIANLVMGDPELAPTPTEEPSQAPSPLARGDVEPSSKGDEADDSPGPSDASVKPDEGAARREALNILAQTERLIAKGKAMEPLRQTSDPSLLAKCGEQMRELQPAARVLSDDAMALPLEIRADVTAPAETVMCVSCSREAASACRRAEAATVQGRRSLSN